MPHPMIPSTQIRVIRSEGQGGQGRVRVDQPRKPNDIMAGSGRSGWSGLLFLLKKREKEKEVFQNIKGLETPVLCDYPD